MLPTTLAAQGQNIAGTVTLSATATDTTLVPGDLECGVSFVQFYLAGIPMGPAIYRQQGSDTYSYSWNTTTVADNDYVLTALAVDGAGGALCDGTSRNTGSSNSILIHVNNHPVVPPTDTTPPTITIAPPTASIVSNKSQVIKVATTDASKIQGISLKINDVTKATNIDSNVLNYTWNTSPYKGTTVKLEAASKDIYGNIGTIISTVTVRK